MNDNIGKWHGTLQELAEEMANLRYNLLDQLFHAFSEAIRAKSNNEPNWQLSARLTVASQHADAVMHDFKAAQKVSK